MEEKGEKVEVAKTVLPQHMGGGPKGLGDPNSTELRKVEVNVVIPKLMRTRAKEKCKDEVKEFESCAKDAGLLLPFKCRKENNKMVECQAGWVMNKEFFKQCKAEYLKDRAEYRETGISKKQKKKESSTF